jgi:hypothetical protein
MAAEAVKKLFLRKKVSFCEGRPQKILIACQTLQIKAEDFSWTLLL